MTNGRRDYENSGTLGRNDRKEKASQPDHRGRCDITCPSCRRRHDFWLSAWIKEGPDDSKFFSLSFTPKDEERSSSRRDDRDDDRGRRSSRREDDRGPRRDDRGRDRDDRDRDRDDRRSGRDEVTGENQDFDDDIPF